MHNYVLIDVIECYEMVEGTSFDELFISTPIKKFVGHNYVIGCYSCEETRVVREDTFEKMMKNNLIEVIKNE